MNRYRRKPTVVTAVEWTATTVEEAKAILDSDEVLKGHDGPEECLANMIRGDYLVVDEYDDVQAMSKVFFEDAYIKETP